MPTEFSQRLDDLFDDAYGDLPRIADDWLGRIGKFTNANLNNAKHFFGTK